MAITAAELSGATAHDLTVRKFGGPVRPVTGNVQVSAAGSRVLANNPRRVAFIIVNRSSVDVSLDFQSSVDTTAALLVAANGGSLTAAVDEDGELTGWELFGKSASGTTAVYVVEIMRQ